MQLTGTHLLNKHAHQVIKKNKLKINTNEIPARQCVMRIPNEVLIETTHR